MTKDLVESLETMVKEFNAQNFSNSYSFVKKEFSRGDFSFTLTYKLLYSSDMKRLVRFCLDNDLHFMSGSLSAHCAYFDIQ